MKALIFKSNGLENLEFRDIDPPQLGVHEVLVKVKMAGVNPIDHFVATVLNVTPIPHIPGAEVAGVVERVPEGIKSVKPGDRVVVYSRVFDGSCDMCLAGYEMVCRKGGVRSVITNGGFAEYISAPYKNLFKIPDDYSWELAASLPVAALTSYHALKEANLGMDDSLVVFGASGNTGIFAVQFGKRMGAKVIAVSSKAWVKDLGADYLVDREAVVEKVEEITGGRMADVVLDPLGAQTWERSIACLGANGRWVTFGALTGGEVKLPISTLYSKHQRLIGSTGGSRKDLQELIELSRDCKVRVWKKFKLEDGRKALECLFSKERDGRILIEIS